MYKKHLLSVLLMIDLAGWCCCYTIQPLQLNLRDDRFWLSLPSDPDIKWVSFNVNINKEFKAFESGQLTGVVTMPNEDKNWSFRFTRKLNDDDIIYVWVAVQHKRLIFRDKKDPISVEAFKSGNPNYTITTINPLTETTETNKICVPTVSELPKSHAGGPNCRDDLIFSDNFDVLNDQYWTNEIRFATAVDDAEFVLYNGTVAVKNGVLKIVASLNSKNLQKDSIDLGTRCTSLNVATECSVKPLGVLILPPIISGRLSTKNSFQFKYGRVVVRAKMPKGDWLFPLIALQPNTPAYGEHYKSGEMRIAYIRANRVLNWRDESINGGRLYGGAILNTGANMRDQFMKAVTLPNVEHFGDDFHLYELIWTPKELTMLVDGKEYGRVQTNFKDSINEPIWNKGGDNAPLDQMFHITLGLLAGGNGDFPQTEGKPWSNTDPRGILYFFRNKKKWLSSWLQPSLEVDYVKVYAV